MPTRLWRHRTGTLELGRRTLLMGIINITPDSFSDGGQFQDSRQAAEFALQLVADGADLLDFGAESTRPGSEPVPASTQLERLLPVLEHLQDRCHVPLSVDTQLAAVAEPCLRAGAAIINDVSALRADPGLAEVCARSGAGVVLMHMRGVPRTMQQTTDYDDVSAAVRQSLRERVIAATAAGIAHDRIVVDPGLGFGKTFDQNYCLLAELSGFQDLAAGVLVGPSRKGFTGEFSQRPAPERQFSTAAVVALAALKGADILRVHDVQQMRQVTDIIDRYRELHDRTAHI